MKNNQLLVLSLLIGFCVASDVQAEDKMKGLEKLVHIGNSSRIYGICDDNFTSDCETLTKMILEAQEHKKKAESIKKLQKVDVTDSTNGQNELMAAILQKKIDNFLDYEKSYLLINDNLQRVNEALANILANSSAEDIQKEIKIVAAVFADN